MTRGQVVTMLRQQKYVLENYNLFLINRENQVIFMRRLLRLLACRPQSVYLITKYPIVRFDYILLGQQLIQTQACRMTNQLRNVGLHQWANSRKYIVRKETKRKI